MSKAVKKTPKVEVKRPIITKPSAKPSPLVEEKSRKVIKNSIAGDPKNRTNVLKTKTATTKVNTTNVKKPTTTTAGGSTTTTGVVKRTKPTPMKAVAPNSSKPNVMTKVHNVTVLSPPVKKKEIGINNVVPEDKFRERTRTRTLEPHEVLVLKNNAKEVPTAQTIGIPSLSSGISLDSIEPTSIEPIKMPVSFEINFEKPKAKVVEAEKSKKISDETKNSKIDEFGKMDIKMVEVDMATNDYDYEDDFESYESDFESGSSSKHSSVLSSSSTSAAVSSEDDETENDEEHGESVTDKNTAADTIREERKLDSGNYELRGTAKEKIQIDSIEEDSGIENMTSKLSKIIVPQPSPTKNPPKMLSAFDIRGRDLMNKIQLDTMNFLLFDLKPMGYEYFMKVYGNADSLQNSTQTYEDVIHQDSQTDAYHVKSAWTQFPPRLSKQTIESIHTKKYFEDKNGVGDGDEIVNPTVDIFALNIPNTALNLVKSISTIDYDRLNIHLQRTSLTLFEILNRKRSKNKVLQKTNLKISKGFTPLKFDASTTKTFNIYTNSSVLNTILTVNNSANEEFLHTVSVWNVFDLNKPLKILSSWSQISCLEIHNALPNVVFAGLIDGSIAVWDMRENSYWHPVVHNKDVVRVPSQIVVTDAMIGNTKIEDYGRVVAIKTMYSRQCSGILKDYNPVKICSLHEIGFLTLWTILESQTTNLDIKPPSPDHSVINNISPWSKIRLIQSAAIDLRDYFEYKLQKRPTSSFEKKRSYFENNIFSDDILQELHGNDEGKEFKMLSNVNLRFTDVVSVKNGFFVGLNKNYLLFCTNSLKIKEIKKIIIDDTLTVQSLITFNGDQFIGIGLSDGTIKIYSCLIDAKPDISEDADDKSKNVKIEPSASTSSNQPPNLMTKSCAIQNIVQGERKIYDSHQASFNLDSQEMISSLKFGNSTKQLHINNNNNNQILMSNFSLKKQSVKKILITRDETLLFAVVGDHLMVYDLKKSVELDAFSHGEEEEICDIGLVENDKGVIYLVTCCYKTGVHIHEINEKLFVEF